jgi:hypothetical protein
MKFDHLDKTKDLAHAFSETLARRTAFGGHKAHKALKAHTFSAVSTARQGRRQISYGVKVMNPRPERNPEAVTNATSGPRAPMRALLQPKLRVRLSRPSRHIAKRTNRINRLIWINPVDELMKGHIFLGIVTPHAWVPNNRVCIA